MDLEARFFRLGELRREDVRLAVGDAYETVSMVRVLVLGRPGEMPSSGVVQLTTAQSGRGQQRMLVCPGCAGGRRALYADGSGGFRCTGCLRRRTRQQMEKRRTDYRDQGGREEDQILRLVQQHKDPGRVRRLVDRIVAGDYARLETVQPKVSAALALVEERQ